MFLKPEPQTPTVVMEKGNVRRKQVLIASCQAKEPMLDAIIASQPFLFPVHPHSFPVLFPPDLSLTRKK